MVRVRASDFAIMRTPAVILALSLILCMPFIAADESELLKTDEFEALDAEAVIEMIEQAEAARNRASDLRAEWLETRALIDEARRAADLGEPERAAQLAALAQWQSELAAEQALREAEDWKRRAVR